MAREVRVSPNGNAVAIRSDTPDPENEMAWGVMNCKNGGHWSKTAAVAAWTVVQEAEEEEEE